mmetsp:Transcript_132643/g.296643  ORF Transcript_132643/g.296643 Transcript_132643/m.296643 type:complete len:685 (+) Transcript_132643:96-2150(+)
MVGQHLLVADGAKDGADSELLASQEHLIRLQRRIQEHAKRLDDLEMQSCSWKDDERSWRRAAPPQRRSPSDPADPVVSSTAPLPPEPTTSPLVTEGSLGASAVNRSSANSKSTACNTPWHGWTGVDVDAYSHMWSHMQVGLGQKQIFEKEQLKLIYEKPFKRSRQQAAMAGGGILGIMSMPFGPIGMAAGGMFGAIFGGIVGICMDLRRRQTKLQDADLEKRRLRSLVRWAKERFREDGDLLMLIEMVALEFKPMADIAEGSQTARNLILLLDGLIANKKVARCLLVYMEQLLQRWRELHRAEFLRSMLVFQTLVVTYKHTNRLLDEQEIKFVDRMERLLAHKSVKSVMEHALMFPTQGETRIMECMVYSDALSGSSSGKHSPAHSHHTSKDGDLEPEAERETLAVGEAGQKQLALKKPFFRSWDDFMDFDCTFKHCMPITLSEFALLLQKEAESTKGWDVCVDRKEIKVAKVQSGLGGITLRAWAQVPGVDLHVAFFLFYDISERVKWDKTFSNISVVNDSDVVQKGNDIIYSMMKVPTVTTREFLQYRRVSLQDDGSILILLRSAEHKDKPEAKGIIRVENYISGYVLRQAHVGDQPVLNIFILSCNDVKGMIPKWIVNMMAPKKPGEWVESLRKAAVDYQAKYPDCKKACLECLSRFAGSHPCDYEPEDADSPLRGEATEL